VNTRSQRRAALTCFCLVAALLAGCSTSTSPTSGTPSGSPGILTVSPSQPSISDIPQSLSFSGSNFEQGLVGAITRPGGTVVALSASDIRNVTTTSFQVNVTLDVVGDYQLQVKNPSGLSSSPFTISVRPAAQGSLTLNSVSPATVLTSSQQQAIFVIGTNFDSTLEAIIIAPDSSQSFYTSASMAGLTSTSFGLNVVFDKVGFYTLTVRNGSNSTSNLLTIEARRSF
jgi:hypothetical protein